LTPDHKVAPNPAAAVVRKDRRPSAFLVGFITNGTPDRAIL
jgi:hypothetical protein